MRGTGATRAPAALLLILLACANAAQATIEEGSVLAVAKKNGATTFIAAVEAAGLTSVLGKAGLYATIFVPTNEAFAAAGNVPAEVLPSILKYHVVPDRRISSKRLLFAGRLFTLLQPKFLRAGITWKLKLRIVGETNNVGVVHPNLYTAKGVIHIVDGVLVPKLPAPAASPPPPSTTYPTCATVLDLVKATPDLSTLRDLVIKANLAGALADPNLKATIVAPTNAAFTKIPGFIGASLDLVTQTLLYHVIPGPGKLAKDVIATAGTPFSTLASVGGPLKFGYDDKKGIVSVTGLTNTAVVVLPNILACSGTVIHIIDVVLIPYYSPPPPPPPPPPPSTTYPSCATVLDLVKATPNLSTLRDLVIKANLTAALADPNLKATIVAPVNAAFAKVPAAIANNLDALTQTLLYHVIPGPGKPSQTLIKTAGTPFNTLASKGGPLTFKYIKKGHVVKQIFVHGAYNYASIVKYDIPACSGSVVHIISDVLIPYKITY